MKNNIKKQIVTVFSVSAALMVFSSVGAQPYPVKPVRIVVPFPAGGGVDVTARILAQQLTIPMGQSFVVENRAGAAGVIGTEFAAKSAPDGYTLLATTSAFTMNPVTHAKLPFDTQRDFAPISLTANSDFAFMVNPVVPARTVKEFIAVAKARRNVLTYGSSGNGGSLHLAGEMLKLAAGIDMLHVPYKGASLAMADVIGGHVDVMFISVPPAIPMVKGGKLRALGTASAKRARGLPEVPTFIELGYADFTVDANYGLAAPAATPRDIVSKLSAAVAKAAQMADMKERYAGLGLEALANTPEQYAEFIRRDIAKWRKVVAAAKLTPQ